MVSGSFSLKDFSVMLYFYFSNMLEVGVPGFTQTPQLLVYNLNNYTNALHLSTPKTNKLRNDPDNMHTKSRNRFTLQMRATVISFYHVENP